MVHNVLNVKVIKGILQIFQIVDVNKDIGMIIPMLIVKIAYHSVVNVLMVQNVQNAKE